MEADVLVVDVANVMGSRPDGWWKDRAAAATRLMSVLTPPVAGIGRVVAVVEGRALTAGAPAGVEVVRAPRDGDSSIVEIAGTEVAAGRRVLVVTADRGLRDRLPEGAQAVGPRWLLDRV